MQLASAGNLEGVGVLGILHTQGYVGVQLSVQPVADVAGSDVFSFLAGQRTVVDTEVHGDCRLLDLLERDRVRLIHRADGIADVKIVDAGQSDNGTDGGRLYRDLLQAVEFIQLRDADFLFLGTIMMIDQQGILVDPDAAAVDLADADPADIFVVIDGGDQHLERSFRITLRCRDIVEDRLEERGHVRRLITDLLHGVAFLRGCEDKGAVQLLVGSIQVHQQFQRLIHNLIRASARAVDLVDADDERKVQGQRLLGDETGLRHRAFKCIYHKNDTVDHLQDTLNLATEVSVTGSIYNIDLRPVVGDGCVFGQNRDSSFTFDIAGVHDTFRDFLILTEHAALAQQAVDKSRLAVIDVCYDRNISYIFSDHIDSFLYLFLFLKTGAILTQLCGIARHKKPSVLENKRFLVYISL